jgi:hypothetical protein
MTKVKRPKRAALNKARYALSKAENFLQSKNALGIFETLLPALEHLEAVDDYEDLQALLHVWIGMANLMLARG